MKTKYLLIGSGRLSSHFGAYFRFLGLEPQVWSRRTHSISDLKLQLTDVSHVLCLISDGAIEPFLSEHAALFANKTVIHCSGSLITDLAYSAHPLMTFRSDVLYSLETYRSIPFIVEKQSVKFSELLPDLPNESFEVAREHKGLYHALCVLSGNFTTLLWQKAFSDFKEKLALPPDVLLPYLKQVTRNLEENPDGALTGPIARKDLATINTHLRELEGDKFQQVYRGFVAASGMEV